MDSVLGGGDDGAECEVHGDLDRLDTGIGLANEYAAPRGLRGCLEVVARSNAPDGPDYQSRGSD